MLCEASPGLVDIDLLSVSGLQTLALRFTDITKPAKPKLNIGLTLPVDSIRKFGDNPKSTLQPRVAPLIKRASMLPTQVYAPTNRSGDVSLPEFTAPPPVIKQALHPSPSPPHRP